MSARISGQAPHIRQSLRSRVTRAGCHTPVPATAALGNLFGQQADNRDGNEVAGEESWLGRARWSPGWRLKLPGKASSLECLSHRSLPAAPLHPGGHRSAFCQSGGEPCTAPVAALPSVPVRHCAAPSARPTAPSLHCGANAKERKVGTDLALKNPFCQKGSRSVRLCSAVTKQGRSGVVCFFPGEWLLQ